MRFFVPAMVLLGVTGCFVDPADPTGRACDDTHPCSGGRICIEGVCRPPTAAPEDAGSLIAPCEPGASCSVGVGECQRYGVLECPEDGGQVCQAVMGTPSAESCDGLDNDCDGRADVSAEVPLVSTGSTGTAQGLSWAYTPDGLAAVYTSDRGQGPNVYFQRFDHALGRVGEEVMLTDTGGATLPSFLPVPDGGVVVWREQIAAPRLAVAMIDSQGVMLTAPTSDGGVAPVRRYFNNQDVRGTPHVARSGNDRFVMLAWVTSAERAMAAVVENDVSVFRPPTLLTLDPLADGGVPLAQDIHLTPVGATEFLVGISIREEFGSSTLFQRHRENLSRVGVPLTVGQVGAASNVRTLAVPNPDGGFETDVAGLWLQSGVSTTVEYLPGLATTGPVSVVGPASGGAWTFDAAAVAGTPVVAWIESENLQLYVRRLEKNTTRDLTPKSSGVRTYLVGAEPSLAVSDGGLAAMGYALTKPGQGVSLYGQLFCLP